MRKGISYPTQFPLLSHILEMPMFFEYKIFEYTLLLQIIVILAFKKSSKYLETGAHAHIGSALLSLHTLPFEGFANWCGLQKPPGCSHLHYQSDLLLIRQKNPKGPWIMPVFTFIPTLYTPIIICYLPREYSRNWVIIVLPLHIFTWCLVMSRGFSAAQA